jgi:hypothetical protein
LTTWSGSISSRQSTRSRTAKKGKDKGGVRGKGLEGKDKGGVSGKGLELVRL